MLSFIRSLFAWRTIRDHGMWRYQENGVTGARRALRIEDEAYAPLDVRWLEAGASHYVVN